MIKVEVISIENIKPSSPTPASLSSYKLSSLDQLAPPFYVPLVLFYTRHDHGQHQNSLKTTLSKTLTRFYPFAGRLKDEYHVDCNDQGVEFTEARVNVQLAEFLRQPEVDVLNLLFRFNPFHITFGMELLLAIQLNIFECGGMAIAVLLSHKIADGATIVAFLNAWSATARGVDAVIQPKFIANSLFPARASISHYFRTTEEKVLTVRFMIDALNIAALINRSASSSQGWRPTRIEAVSALIWGALMRVRSDKGLKKASVALHAVNLRPRMTPPLPDCSFGNLWVHAVTAGVAGSERVEDMQRCMEGQVRDAIKAVDTDYIEELRRPDGALRFYECMESAAEKYSSCGMDVYHFTSWCRFPCYEMDFGWGKPVWISGSIPVKNAVLFLDGSGGDGMEAWVTLVEDEMEKLKSDPELLSFFTCAS
ncbi:vinorine synthase-like protein [Cinnamomum micranthum f. kanehirae]|uniref:Vinorine synthase-like protein n=1 Tax=Cinnamomum micranthum f. kanehirae TaxID=337451 RepID=A0A3S4Q202_9MAGN|nr:vinorine synthase-like protein [Cinnamomum micranthum f. kanehirae]